MTLLKVGCIGAGGTGKTTVINLLKEDPEIKEEFHPSVVRRVYEKMGIQNELQQFEMTPRELWELQEAILMEKLGLDGAYKTGLFDRTPIDHAMYALWRCGNHMTDYDCEWLENVTRAYMENYDLLFFFPVYDWPREAAEDQFRQTNFAYRLSSDVIMRGLINKYNLRVYKMDDVPAEERVAFIKDKMIRTRYEKARLVDELAVKKMKQ